MVYSKTKNAEDSMDDLMKSIPKNYWGDLNDLFVLHGQNICFTNSPKCSVCAISSLCPKIGVERKR